MPIGVWRSTDPHIILYIEPAYQHPLRSNRYFGIYTVDGEERKVFVSFGNSPRFDIHNIAYERWESPYFRGEFRVRGDRMYYTNQSGHLRVGGRRNIIFYRLEDYEPIDPFEWSPDLQHLRGIWKSDYPDITLYFDTAYQSPISPHFLGIYTVDSEERRIFVYTRFHGDEMRMGIHDIASLNVDGGRSNSHDWFLPNTWFQSIFPFGEFAMVDGQLHYHLQEVRDGRAITIDTIIFHRVEDYRPINPEVWFSY